MDSTIRVFSGREFSSEDIALIKWTRRTYPQLAQSELAATVCEILGWTTPAGRPKAIQCKVFLRLLESEGEITLPPIKARILKGNGERRVEIPEIVDNAEEITGEIGEFEPIYLEIAWPGEDLKRWRGYVQKYHMLGYKMVFGSRLHYFIKSGDIELGCMQFSASSWALEKRDKWIKWQVKDKKERLHLILNNSRYLIFPWVHIKNLASKALSLAAKQIQADWLKEYCYAPVLLETFVNQEHYQGTCYKAANWLYLGQTKGLGRKALSRLPNRSPKDIYVYPLQKDFKACLRGEKPYKVVDPDE